MRGAVSGPQGSAAVVEEPNFSLSAKEVAKGEGAEAGGSLLCLNLSSRPNMDPRPLTSQSPVSLHR
jgi:hypothetical protein